jgi:hypothetical protein
MYKNLDTYLEEIGHYLSGREERQEILSEIRSHVMEKAEAEGKPVAEAAIARAIADYGKPRQVAEKYLEGRPLIAPAFARHLFRYASLLFIVHLAFIVLAVVFRKSFIVFPFLFVPRLGVIAAVLYLPMAFLADFGAVALVLYFITRSGKEIRLPWPRFAVDLDEVQATDARTLASRVAAMVGAGIMLALTGVGLKLFLAHRTLFFSSTNFKGFRPLFTPEPGRRLSLIALILIGAGTIELLIKAFSRSRRVAAWVNAAANAVALVMIGLLFSQPYGQLFAVHIPEKLQSWLRPTLVVTLLVIALAVGVDLVVNLVRLGRTRMGAGEKR